ncbi:hypothetical protein [Deminuibacter soli]|uniref:Uncharacterized protein n=1 Tax=Deminuibacter soli TaxID=2291815 RepID=A0A3E1NFA4_9BACT|nr:hypothetical protein [Deminuibacter soli]RFM26557.1 hypothetical protein DXN05_18440 [Deminuibacter soli]
MKYWCYRVVKKLRWLSDFRKPRFASLDCIDLVVENRQLLLLSWDTVHAGKIRVSPGNIVYRKRNGAAVCSLPAGTACVTIKLSNVWRSVKTVLPLKHVHIDAQTLHYFDAVFLNALTCSIATVQPGFTMPAIQLKKLQLQLPLTINAAVYSISINQPQLTYYVP